MAMWKLVRNKRGVTPVLSNLLLMVVAVAAMSIAAVSTYVITTNLRETMGERLIIEDVWFNNATAMGEQQISVYIRNVGKVSISISTVYVNHTRRQPSQKLELGLEDHGWLNITYSWEHNSLYYLEIVTTRGTHVGGYYKAP
ncbi:hypothetical protein KEJ45_02115 [Candidatus Bathyarchaeota archaeon]|nr:hypothetical protein [Candidatus Bathyarchaeota archaeon]